MTPRTTRLFGPAPVFVAAFLAATSAAQPTLPQSDGAQHGGRAEATTSREPTLLLGIAANPARYRIRESRTHLASDSERLVAEAGRLCRSVLDEARRGHVVDNEAIDVLLHAGRTSATQRRLYVESTRNGMTLEAYYNDEDELDCVRVAGPGVFVSCNPGRHELNYRIGGRANIELLTPSYLLRPASLHDGNDPDGAEWPLSGAMRDAAGTLISRSTQTGRTLVVEVERGIPVRASLCDPSGAATIASYEFGLAGPEGPILLLRVHRSTVVVSGERAQVTSIEWDLEHERPRSERMRPLEIPERSNLFEFHPGSDIGRFRGRVDVVGVPAVLAEWIVPRLDPRTPWLR